MINGVLVEHTVDGINQLNSEVALRVGTLGSPKEWPLALLPLKLLAQQGDRGAGDIIARTIGPIGGIAFKKWYKTIFGRGCGCGSREETLNARWPL